MHKFLLDYSHCLVIASILREANSSGGVELSSRENSGFAIKNHSPKNSTRLCRLILLIFSQKYKNKLTCGKNPQSRSDWEHLRFVDPDLHDLQISPVDQIRVR